MVWYKDIKIDFLLDNHMKMWISIDYVHNMYTIPRDNQNKQQMRKAGRGTHIRTNLNNWHMRRPFLHSKQLDVLHFDYLRVWMICNYIINTANLYVHVCINEGVFCMLLRQFIFFLIHLISSILLWLIYNLLSSVGNISHDIDYSQQYCNFMKKK